MRERPELTPAHGKPWIIRFDNGLEFLAGVIRSAAMDLAFHPVPLRARSPWLNGKIERWHQTMTRELIRRLPYWTDGPKRTDGASTWPPTRSHWRSRCSSSCCSSGSRPTTSSGPRRARRAYTRAGLGAGRDAAACRQRAGPAPLPARVPGQPRRRGSRREVPARLVHQRGPRAAPRAQGRAAPHAPRCRLGLESISTGNGSVRAVRHDEASDAQRQRVLDARAQAAREAAASRGRRRTARGCAGQR